jgi:hypothetical protein
MNDRDDYAAFACVRIDTFAKESAMQDDMLRSLGVKIAGRFEAKPDFYTDDGRWWYITTLEQWNAQLLRYTERFGDNATILTYK